MKRLAVLLLLVTACSGVTQSEHDAVLDRLAETRDELAVRERSDAEQVTTEAVVAAWANAYEAMELNGLNGVYAEGLFLFDAARHVTFRSRSNAIADLESAIEVFGIETQEALTRFVTPGRAAIEWEMRGVINGNRWALLGVSVLVFDGALIVGESLYYNLADAPWGFTDLGR